MTLQALISELRQQKIRLRTDGEALHYEAADGALTPDLQQRIALHKNELLALLRQFAASDGKNDVITTGDRSQPLPLSFAQERFWFLHQFISDKAVYNVPAALRIEGRLDRDALADALNGLISRHEILRTRFGTGDRGGHQTVCASYVLDLPYEDLTGSMADQDRRIGDLAREDLRKPFDLDQGRVVRARLIGLGEQEHVLLLTVHHIACDAWSLDLWVNELMDAYRAHLHGLASTLPEPLQYGDYARWQREQWNSDHGKQRLAALVERIRYSDAGTVLPADRPRPSILSYRGAYERMTISAATLEPLRRWAAEESASLFMALLAAAKLLLFRYTRQDDISVGVPIIGRSRPELQSAAGCFLNTLALTTRIDAGMSGNDLLRSVRSVCLEGFEYQDVPFEMLVDTLKLKRDLSYNPLFQVLFYVHNGAPSGKNADGLSWRRLPVENDTTKFDLSFEIEENADGAVVSLHYNRDLFDPHTMARLAAHYQTLLRALAEDPLQAIASLPMLTPSEGNTLQGWNCAQATSTLAGTAHHAFEMQAEQQPDAVALVYGTERISYRQLNERANRIAHALRADGIGPGQRVAIHCARSPAMLEAMLGVWKAGAAYVPIDPSYPAERIAFMLDDAQVARVLTQQALTATLPGSTSKQWLLDGDATVFAAQATSNPAASAGLSDLAHIIYTSGSTGRPKGVMIEHRGVLALLRWADDTYTRKELAHVLASTSICFDLSVFELFVPLAVGGCVHLVENVLHLPEHPGRDQIKLINTVPSALKQLLQSNLLPASVNVLNLAGEPLQRSLVDMAYRQPQVTAVYNLYGPSEDTTYSTYVRVPRDTDEAPTIGVPLPGKQLHILDASMQPVPIGVLGEIYIGGEGLARGYFNRPELTAERFVPNPRQPDAKLYRTGDLGQYRADGQVIYAGRTDFQIKLRGFRIELGEIEAALRSDPHVAEAVVVARHDNPDMPQLVAYVAGTLADADLAPLRQHLKDRLPGYMLPSAVVLLDALPMTLNGKVDRNALPTPVRAAPEVTAEPARTGLEKSIAAIWQELLGQARFGVNDNFFEAGGSSLLVLQMQTRLTALLGRGLPIIDLFRYPTIHSLAEFLESAGPNPGSFNHLKDRASKQRAMLVRRRKT
jgi:amino acid adenylation domain-containing protein